jgi:tetratricopeptide (TPR) repeat protein
MNSNLLKWISLSWKIGRIRGVEIRLHFSILFSLLAAGFIFRPTNMQRAGLALLWLIIFLFSFFVHEAGHALAAKLVHADVKSIVIWLLGGVTTLNREPEKPLHRLLIYGAGPLATLLLGGLFFVLYVYLLMYSVVPSTHIYFRFSLSLAVLNSILFIFNILPAYPLDGGVILHAISEFFFGRSRANLITMVISIPVLIGLIAFGIRTHDYILLVFCLLIAFAIGTLNRHSLRWMNLGLNYLLKRSGYYFMQGDYERTIQYCSRDIERHPDQVNHYVARAVCYVWMLRPDDALADVEHALQLAPGNATALLLRADLYSLEKNYDAALELISQAQQANPAWGLPYIDRGAVLLRRREFQNALDEFNKGLSSTTQVPLFYIDRSMAYYRLGDLEAAHRDEEKATELSGNDAVTRPEFNLQVYEGFLDWAEDYYGRLLAKLPRLWRAYQGRADAYRANNEHEKAIADYTRAVAINPGEPLLYLGRGKSYQSLGDVTCATADFHHVLSTSNKTHLQRQAEELLNALTGN